MNALRIIASRIDTSAASEDIPGDMPPERYPIGFGAGVGHSSSRKFTAKVILDESVFGKITRVTEVDLLERPIKPSSASTSKGTVSVAVPARGIATVKVSGRNQEQHSGQAD